MLSLETHRGNREAVREGSYGQFLYNFYRTYDPNTGRYLEADPVGLFRIALRHGAALSRHPAQPSKAKDRIRLLVGESNTYQFVLADPINLTDPQGEAVLVAAAAALVVANVGLNTQVEVSPEGEVVVTIPPPSMFQTGFPLPWFFGVTITSCPVRIPGTDWLLGWPTEGSILVDPELNSTNPPLLPAAPQTNGI